MKLPQARLENIVVQNLNGETLIYNLKVNEAFCLNETAAKVFESCDGETTFNDFKVKHKFTDDLIYLALDGLKKENLITEDYISPFAGMSRREAIKKVGLASMIALPVISALVAPTAASASSICVTGTCLHGSALGHGANVCAGCAGRTIFYTYYASTNGTCTGPSGTDSYNCGSVFVSVSADIRINSYT